MLNFVDGKGFVEDLGNGHSAMVMIPELIDLEANSMRQSRSAFMSWPRPCAREGHDEQQVRRIVRAVGGSGFNPNLFPNVAWFNGLLPRAAADIGKRDGNSSHGADHERWPGDRQPGAPAAARTLPGADGLRHPR